jgi:sugar O-acyltransferase (sialic acid O-acetyltransferase NeuD family)
MLVIGARGFAKEILEVLYQLDWLDNLAFYDDVNQNIPEKLYDRFLVLSKASQAEVYFREKDKRFVLGIGRPQARYELAEKFERLGGLLTTVISPKSNIGHFGTTIGIGTVVMTGTTITNDVTIGKGVLINKNSLISHDCKIGDFVEITPGVSMGRTSIGRFSIIGMGSIIIPGIKIGENAFVGAGAVVTDDVPAGITVVGVPARPLVR